MTGAYQFDSTGYTQKWSQSSGQLISNITWPKNEDMLIRQHSTAFFLPRHWPASVRQKMTERCGSFRSEETYLFVCRAQGDGSSLGRVEGRQSSSGCRVESPALGTGALNVQWTFAQRGPKRSGDRRVLFRVEGGRPRQVKGGSHCTRKWRRAI